MIYSDACPHCGKETDIENPSDAFLGAEGVEQQQDCDSCGESFVADFKVEFVLRGVRAA